MSEAAELDASTTQPEKVDSGSSGPLVYAATAPGVPVVCAGDERNLTARPYRDIITGRVPLAAQLGLLRGKPDTPFGSDAKCAALKHSAKDAWQGLIGPDGRTPVQRGPGSVPESCMASLEPLNPRVPLRGTETCAQNRRRAEALVLQDPAEVVKRRAAAVPLLSACPAALSAGQVTSSVGAPRKILFDAGCGRYVNSTKRFRETYPDGKTFEVFAIDADSALENDFLWDRKAAFYHGAVWNETGFMSFVTRRGLEADGYFHTRWEDMPSTPIKTKLTTVPTIALGPFLRARARVEDFVVVKMDIEGAEWLVLQHLAREGALELIDEMFIECHHAEWVPAWPSQHSLADCHRMFNALRGAGIYAHEWY